MKKNITTRQQAIWAKLKELNKGKSIKQVIADEQDNKNPEAKLFEEDIKMLKSKGYDIDNKIKADDAVDEFEALFG